MEIDLNITVDIRGTSSNAGYYLFYTILSFAKAGMSSDVLERTYTDELIYAFHLIPHLVYKTEKIRIDQKLLHQCGFTMVHVLVSIILQIQLI